MKYHATSLRALRQGAGVANVAGPCNHVIGMSVQILPRTTMEVIENDRRAAGFRRECIHQMAADKPGPSGYQYSSVQIQFHR